ncbi:unnamed protein product, partial [Ascophyllum nodosum]
MPTETSRELLPPTSPLGQEMAKSSAGATSALGVKPGGLVRPSSRNGDAGGALLGGSSPCSSLAVGDVGGEHQAVAEAFGSNCIAGVRLVVEWLGSVESVVRAMAVSKAWR